MNSKLLPFVGGLVLGVVLAIAGFMARKPGPAPAPETPVAAEPAVAPDPRDEALATARRKVASLEADNAKLASRVQSLLAKQPAPGSAPAVDKASADDEANPLAALARAFGGGGETNTMSEAMTGMMRSMLESQIEGKVSILKRRLNLTEEQERTLTAILLRQADASVVASQKMLGGKLSQEELGQLTERAKSPRDEIQAILTPEQWQGFQEHEKAERQQQARAVANAELLQLQAQLGLDSAQEDKVKAVLSDQALAQFNGSEQFTTTAGGANALEFMRQQNERKQEALRGVLTPEQFDRYQKFQAQQMKMLEAFMPKGTGAGAVDVKVIAVPPAP